MENQKETTWSEFFGVDVSPVEFVSLNDAKTVLYSLNIKNRSQLRQYCKQNNGPPCGVPARPDHVYRNKGWVSWGDLWGSSRPSISFKKARKFARSLNLKSRGQWRDYCKSGVKPLDMPMDVENVYKNKGWISWGDFLGTGNESPSIQNKKYLTFPQAKRVVRKLNIKGKDEWMLYRKKNNVDGVPVNPARTYRHKGWTSWGDFLGTGYVAHKYREYVSYDEAKIVVKSLKIKNSTEWEALSKNTRKHNNIPNAPYDYYKQRNEWVSWPDFFGNEGYLSYPDARAYARALNLNGRKQWVAYCRENDIKNIPCCPSQVYKNKGWKNWADFLGTARKPRSKK